MRTEKDCLASAEIILAIAKHKIPYSAEALSSVFPTQEGGTVWYVLAADLAVKLAAGFTGTAADLLAALRRYVRPELPQADNRLACTVVVLQQNLQA